MCHYGQRLPAVRHRRRVGPRYDATSRTKNHTDIIIKRRICIPYRSLHVHGLRILPDSQISADPTQSHHGSFLPPCLPCPSLWPVGLVVKRDREQGTLDLLESTAEGVTVYPLISRLRAYATEFTYYMALRKLQVGRQTHNGHTEHTHSVSLSLRMVGAPVFLTSRGIWVGFVDRRSGRRRWRLGCCSL